MIASGTRPVTHGCSNWKVKLVLVELGSVVENQSCDRPEPLAHAVELGLGVGQLDPQAFVNVFVEMLQQ